VVEGGSHKYGNNEAMNLGIQERTTESSPDTGRRGARGRANWKRVMMPSAADANGSDRDGSRSPKVEKGVLEGRRSGFGGKWLCSLHVLHAFYTLLHNVSGVKVAGIGVWESWIWLQAGLNGDAGEPSARGKRRAE